MNKSLFKTKEEFNKYLNKILATQGTTLPDKMLHLFLWEKIKLMFQYEDTVKEIFLDNEEEVIFLEDENGYLLIGYLQIDRKWDKNSKEDSNTIIKELKLFIEDIIKLSKEKSINSCRCIIVSTFKLSDFGKGVFSILPTNIGYFYLIDIDQKGKYHFDLNKDEEIINRINADKHIDQFFDYIRSKSKKGINEYWTCDICGGNQDTGCLYHDPTECPKFT